jgi:RNA polymerase sigma-70 factor (ECF subfamily)
VAAEQKEKAAVLFRAMQQLPEQQYTAFVLQKVEGLSGAQIADVMKISVGAVESLLQRAKANLRKLLESYYQKHGS